MTKEIWHLPKVPINEKELAHFSNEVLQDFWYGIYNDNALTYMIRMQNEKVFKYLLKWGILPSHSNDDGLNAIHFAVELEWFNFLSFML